MMKTLKTSPTEQLNNLIEFRQSIYDQILVGLGDAQFELIDALLLSGHIECLAELSLSPAFRRCWPSAYQALEAGQQAAAKLVVSFVGQVPQQGVQIFPLDTTMWAHPSARTLSGLVYGRSPTKALKHHSIVQGHQYSLLTWTPQPGQSWSPTVSNRRLEPEQSAIAVGVEQVKQLCQVRSTRSESGLDVIVADGHYGNHHFFGPLIPWPCAALARLYRNRVLYGEPETYRGQGRPAVHGARFAFKEPDSWPAPLEQVDFDHPRWGRVRLRRWPRLHARQEAKTSFDVILAEVHLERDKPAAPLWLGYVPDQSQPSDPSLRDIWSWFDYRWPIEPSLRFRKQKLAWTLPHLQQSAACDRWTNLVDIAYWQTFLARDLVKDQPLPWHKAQPSLTPGRVLRGLGAIFGQLGSPAQPPQSRGKSPGWPTGRPRTRPKRYKPTKRGQKQTKPP